MPPSAYVTLEHEWILIFRKGDKRKFHTGAEKDNRLSSSFFWEERNLWFSDVWHLPGTDQTLDGTNLRSRSGAYPFEIPYRLINMFSVKNDNVLDPFVGTGTTIFAAVASERNSIGVEIDSNLIQSIFAQFNAECVVSLNYFIYQRLERHKQFVAENRRRLRNMNAHHNTDVVTRQEEHIRLNEIEGFQFHNSEVSASYTDQPPLLAKISDRNSTTREPSELVS